jgi:hypothetical protein
MDLAFSKRMNLNKMASFIPEISASKVAGLIGLHAYQNPKEVMYDLLCKHIPTKARIASIEAEQKRVSLTKIKNSVLYTQAVRDVVATGVKCCVGQSDISGVLAEVEKQARTIVNLRHSNLPTEVQDIVVGEIRGSVQRQRGTNNENAILNTYEVDNKVEVQDRNTMTFRKDCGVYKLVGRTDGYVKAQDRIVDSKARTRWWPSVPIYDEIQLRVYMNLSGCAESELVESFPDGRTRTTKYMNDADKWDSIHKCILDTVSSMNEAVENDEKLSEIVFANTVCLK